MYSVSFPSTFDSIDHLLKWEKERHVILPRNRLELDLKIAPLIPVVRKGVQSDHDWTLPNLPYSKCIEWAYNPPIYGGRGFRYSCTPNVQESTRYLTTDDTFIDILVPGIPKNPKLVKGMTFDPMYFPHEIWEKHYNKQQEESLKNQQLIKNFLYPEESWSKQIKNLFSFNADGS